MSCVECRLDYLMDKTAWQDTAIRRLVNTQSYSANSAQVTDAQRATLFDIRGFEERWKGKRCTHGNQKTTAVQPESGSDSIHQESGERLQDPVGNIGLDSIPSRAPKLTSRAPEKPKVGRPPGSKNRR